MSETALLFQWLLLYAGLFLAGLPVARLLFPAAPDDGAATAPAMVVGTAAVGDRVEAVQRRIYTQEGVTRYGFKVQRVD